MSSIRGGCELTVEIDNSSGDSVDINALQAQAEFLIAALSLHPECELSIAIVDVERMTELHVEWMDEPGPTDVLSFPMDELIEGDAEPGVLGGKLDVTAFFGRGGGRGHGASRAG